MPWPMVQPQSKADGLESQAGHRECAVWLGDKARGDVGLVEVGASKVIKARL